MASSSKPKSTYDVFLSFRGTDQRNKFASHLYRALDQHGIYTFRDNEELRKGDQIFPALMKAIEESCIAIIVFSEDYPSSWWCLEEVTMIMKCKKQKHLTVLPVFYKVDPKEVRTGRESYARALKKHEHKYGKDSEKVKRWKEALFEAGSLSGWPLNDEDESELIQEIVEKISTYLAQTPLHVAKHPVGMDSRVVKLKSMLNLESDDGVLMVGLWGQGGIGKTSLAKALYNVIFKQFDGACFLEDVRKTSEDSGGLVKLQNTLLNDILKWQRRLDVSNVSSGKNLIQRRLGHKRVLLILDDVDNLRQLDTLAGERKWFGNGSRIIITTRDKHLLTCQRIDQNYVYEVEALDNNQARKLLSKHAFQTHQIRTDLVDSALNYAKGLPLALEVLGSFLCGRREREWESTLKELSRIPNEHINGVLKISYDGLEEKKKEIFLHIACFFNGNDSEYVKNVLDSCDLEATIGLEILIERSLISIGWTGSLKMHDLIQAMGREIVNQECRDDPGRRSRLWLYDDVVNVLSCDMGNCAVKAIVLKRPKPTEMCISQDAFTKMRRLKLLILCNVHSSFQGPICLPDELRWFEWPGCARQIPEFSSGPKKLVGLNISKGTVTGVVKRLKDFQNLKYINFSHCESLVRMPDLSCTPNIEELDLQNCKNLIEAHESLAYLDKLQVLNLEECSELSVFPSLLKSKYLRTLNLKKCTKFERFPDIPHKLEGLKELHLESTAIIGLPASIENIVSLKAMYLNNCQNLVSLPSNIYKLPNIEDIILEDCTKFIRFPKYEDLGDPNIKIGLSSLLDLDLTRCNLSEVEFLENLSYFPSLEVLHLTGNNITSLPTSINKRDRLSILEVANCCQLQEIPELHPFSIGLWAENCKSLQKIEDLSSIHRFVRRGLADTDDSRGQDWLNSEILLPGGEMPEWVFPIEEGSVSFKASKDLYDKFLIMTFCFVLGNTDREDEEAFSILPHVDGQDIRKQGRVLPYLLDSDHIYLYLIKPSMLWGAVDFGQNDENYVEFSLTVSGRIMKKWGSRIICKQLGGGLKVELRDNQLIDLAFLYEVGHESTNSEINSSPIHKDSSIETNLQIDLQDSQRSAEEQSHKLFSLETCEPRPRGLLIRLAEMSMVVFARCFCC